MFDKMPNRDKISWITMIFAYENCLMPQKTIDTFKMMKAQSIMPKEITIAIAFSACSCLCNLDIGMNLLEVARQTGLISYAIVANSLIDMYAKCKCIDKALEVFHSTLDKNIVSQTSIILGLGINIGRPNPNSVTLVYVLSACGRIGSFDTGKKDPSPCIENWRYAEPGKGAHATKLFQRMIQIVPVKRLCRTQNILTVNRQFPGPTMEARNGDSLAIKEVNDGPYNISIHWHGLRMLRNPWADGPSYVTQCPIQPGGSYTYHFTIQNQELFVAIANHRMTVVATNVAHTNPFTTNVTADQTPGRY